MNHKQRIDQQNKNMPPPMLAIMNPKRDTTLEPGTAVTMTYRQEKGYTGVVLAANDIEAWAGRQAVSYAATPTQEQVDAHITLLAEMDKRQAERGFEPFEPTVPVRWSFGRVHWERVKDLIVLEATP